MRRDPERTRLYRRKFYNDRAVNRRVELIRMLGGVCVDCKTTSDLQFDHVDPETKAFDVSRYIHTLSMQRLVEEASKCQLRCRDCHITRTRLLRHNRLRKIGAVFSGGVEAVLDNELDDEDWEVLMGRA